MGTLFCLALAVYHEARSEPLEGQIAVAQVVLNRVDNSRFPGTSCEVIYQENQFPWTEDEGHRALRNLPAWEEAIVVAHGVRTLGLRAPGLERSLHFHATWDRPYWAAHLPWIMDIGGHRFYE